MPRPATTDQTRIARTTGRASALQAAVIAARKPGLSPDAQRAAWAEVATLAGNVQRDTRILAGLGRGG